MKKIFSIFIFIIFLFSFTFIDNKKETSITVENSKKYDLDYFKEYFNNNDIVGTIKIDDTSINNFIVKGVDNKYYLNHSIDKKYDVKGSIFLDYRVDLNSKQINIYGHNSNYYKDLPFHELESYLNKNFYNTHRYIKIWDGINDNIYEIFSIQLVTNDYEHMNVFPKDVNNHLEKISKSIYETGVDINMNDQILVLQTCSYTPKGYIVIYSKKIDNKV